MSTKTTNLQLTKPAYGEAADIAVINTNMDTIDTAVAGKVTAPSSTVTANTVAVFDGTSGKLVKSSGFTIGKSVPSNAVFTDNNTLNTAGTTNKTGTKLFLAGATSQSANPQTYSNSNVYIGTDNKLYSNGKVVLNADDKTTAVTAGSSKLPTSGAVASAMAGKVDTGKLLSIELWQEGQFSYGTWLGPWDFDQILTIRSRNSQNLSAEITWEGNTGNFYVAAQHWDNNHGDGISSLTVVVRQGQYIRIWSNASRDTDQNTRILKYRLKA